MTAKTYHAFGSLFLPVGFVFTMPPDPNVNLAEHLKGYMVTVGPSTVGWVCGHVTTHEGRQPTECPICARIVDGACVDLGDGRLIK
jgi:hypothetical protein